MGSKKINIEKTKNPESTRRDFLKTAWKGLGIIAGLEFAGLTLHFLSDKNIDNKNNALFDAGLIEEIPKNSVTPFRRGHFYLIHFKDGGLLAMSIKCTHLGCSILWDEKENEFFCPCHSSKFELNGNVIKPPAPRPLDIYKVSIENGRIKINLNKIIRREIFNKSQLTYA